MNKKEEGIVEEIYLAPETNDELEALAESEVFKADDIGEIPALAEEKSSNLSRVIEIPELRGENKKVYRMSDGTEQAVFYPSAIHVFDDERQMFEEVDNTVREEDDGKHFICGKNSFIAKFSREEDNDELFSIEQGMHRVAVFSKKNSKNRNKGVKPEVRKRNGQGQNLTDILTFANVETGTDYEYSVEGSGIKEDIVIKEKTNVYRYPFILRCENVTPQFDENKKRIGFLSNETGEEVFYIPAPFMSDANGAVSTSVSYAMKTAANGDVHLIVTADSEWINADERALPVVIDPQVKVNGSTAMTTYSWDNGNLYSASLHNVSTCGSGDGSCNSKRMYINLKIPQLPRNPRIKKVELKFYQSAGSTYNSQYPKFGLYQVTGQLCIGNCTPATFSDLIDFERMKSGYCEAGERISYTFDITKFVDAVNKSEASYSYANLALKMLDESNTCNNSITLYGSSSTSYKPELLITYESSYGVNTSYRTHTHELGRFGQGSIDLQCGNLMFESEDFAWAGNRMPVTIKHLYNSALYAYRYTSNSTIKLNTVDFTAMKLGYGYKLNIMQSIKSITFQHEGVSYTGYVYIDENGDELYFKKSTKTECCNSNTQCYNLYEDINGSEMLYDPVKRILTQGDETYLFDISGRLIQVKDKSGNRMDINYTSNRISSVTDGAGRDFDFAYNTDGYLTSITAPDGTSVVYTYSGNLLSTVTYPDGRSVEIQYTSSRPTAVILKDSNAVPVYKVAYTYSKNRVASVTEYGVENGEFVTGVKTAYTYSVAARRTIAQTTELKDVDEGETANNVVKTVYTFDDDGNIASEYVYSQDTGNVGVEGEESGIHPHSADGGAGVVSNINNLLLGHNFESLSSWSYMEENCGNLTVSNGTQEWNTMYGKRLLSMQSNNASCTQNGMYQVTNTLPAGEYTFSVYARIKSAFSGTENPGAYIRVTTTDGTVFVESEHISRADNEYIRLIAPFTLTSSQSVRVELLVDGKGLVYFDAAQLENNPYANAYNMLENGSFERSSTWLGSSGVAYISGTCFSMSRSLKMTGNLDAKRYVYQQVPVKIIRDTRETFTLSGWAKGYGIVDRERDNVANRPLFRLRAVVKYNDSTYNTYDTDEFVAEFSPCTEEWQFASVEIAKPRYRTVDYIIVYCEYNYNIGTAYFDNIQLVRNSLETDLSASDFDGSASQADTDVTDTENVNNSEDTVEDTATTFEEVIDAFGNALTETTFTDGEFGTIYRAFGFTPEKDENGNTKENAGNDLIRETDARGNETLYTVNEDTSRNEEVIDRLGNKTAYEYDDSGRTTKVISKNASDTEIANVSYSYDSFDNMTEIVRGDGMKYVLEYNAYHNLESIGINDKTEKLVQYTYKTGNGRLKQLTYANGDNMKATYNSIGQMIAEKWYDKDGNFTAHYKYVYDGQGNIVRSIDILGEKEYNYTYENGKIVRATESVITIDNSEIITQKVLVNSIQYTYDSEDKLAKKRIIPADGTAQVIYYENSDDDNTVVKFTAGGKTVTSHSKTDSFGRKEFDELQLGTGFVSRQFHYHAGEVTEEHKDNGKLKSSATTQLVSQIVFSDNRTISYEYDAEERITKVEDSVDGITEYTYDALGQLLTETVNNTVVNTMTYDNYGNILTKNGVVYTYGDSIWKDLLTSYNGQSITYDAQGNPTNYLGNALTWEKGRQLKSFGNNTYTYNANGIRTSKTVDTVRHDFVLDGVKILKEVWNSNTLIPLYDNEDTVCGIIYNGTPYYFHKNLQGDIIAIVNKDAAVVARYTYDAWGVPTIAQDSSGCSIASINPFRYRGYYYDTEIGMYYLQSRYYDPAVCRFVNGDDPGIIDSASDYNIIGINKYAYCLNNPINNTDSYGTIANFIIKMIGNFLWGMVGGMLGLYLANVTLNIANGKKNFYVKNDSWGTYIAEGVKSGAFAIFGSKLVYKIIAVIGASVLKQFVDMLIYKTSFNIWRLLTDIILGILFVIVLHFGPTVLKKLSSKKKKNSSKWIAKLKVIVKKIADYLISKLKKAIDKLVSFFKNTFVKRFSISYAKRIGSELKKIFT